MSYYASNPIATIVYPTTNLSYIIITYYGNTIATSNTISSGNQISGSYITGDLSFNTKYNFTLTPYNTSGAGIARNITIDTTPKIAGVKMTFSNSSSTQIQWSGNYNYVKLSRADGVGRDATVGNYIDISTIVLSSIYNDKDLSGNTTYNYYVTPYSNNTASTSSSIISIYTNVMAATDLSAIYIDSSSIQIKFTIPIKNKYNTSCSYTLSSLNGTTGYITNISGSSSPLLVQNLSSNTTYTCYIKTTLDSLYTATSNSISAITTTAPITPLYSNITATPVYIASGSVYNFTLTGTNLYNEEVVTGATGLYSYANGTYIVTCSSVWNGNWPSYNLFNYDTTTLYGWFAAGSTYSMTTGLYTGSVSTTSSPTGTITGEYCQIKLPYNLRLKTYKVMNPVRNTTVCNQFYLLASTDGTTWTTIDHRYITTGFGSEATYTLSITVSYNYFRIIISTISTTYCFYNSGSIQRLTLMGDIYG